jgi:hypothetical protein
MGEYKFGGAAPDHDPAALLQEVIQATLAYAQAARDRMGLHSSKRIAVAVPVDVVKRPIFEQAEPVLWDLGVRLDWSSYTMWQVPYALAAGADPLDLIGYRAQPSGAGPVGGWRVTPRAQRMPFSMTAQEARAFAARLLAAADSCDDHNRIMPAPPAGETAPSRDPLREGVFLVDPDGPIMDNHQ